MVGNIVRLRHGGNFKVTLLGFAVLPVGDESGRPQCKRAFRTLIIS
jgi:hypothetical protein